MKRQVTGILIGTMFAATAVTLPASATVTNINSQHLIDAENNDTQLVERHSDEVGRRRAKKPPSLDSSVSNFLHSNNIPASKSEWENFGSKFVHDAPTIFSLMLSQVKFNNNYYYYIAGIIVASIARRRDNAG